MAGIGGVLIRRLVLAAGVMSLAVAVTPRSTSAAFTLALSHGDYPNGSRVAELPATNHEADLRLGPVHRSSFERLHRTDGEGWLQAAVWHFITGRGGTRWQHRTVFLYGINIFRSAKSATQALADVKLRTRLSRVAHLPSRLYRVSDAHQTLIFQFFVYREVEVEAYYEYKGVAPAGLAGSLRHRFGTQTSHLASLARKVSALLHRKPTATPLPSDTPTATATSLPTATVIPTAAPSPTVTQTLPPTAMTVPTATSTTTEIPSPSPTATAARLVVQAAPARSAYSSGENAIVNVQVTLDGKPLAGASVSAFFNFPGQSQPCAANTDAAGNAVCSALVPNLPNGTNVPIVIEVTTADAGGTSLNTFFTIQQ
ncbi:MAG TPA: hypothetical protein VF221_06940 [Chloroflexota bacterium]